MSLMKKPRMTEKKLAAIRKVQKLSHGPATPEGRARIRDAHLIHGGYSKSDEVALRALGEDPEDFRELLEGLADDRTAAAALRKTLGEHMARSFWRMRRAYRMQEGCALRQAKEEDATRAGRLHVRMMRLKMISRNWQLLAEAVKNPHYVTTPHDLEMMKHLHSDGVAKDMSEVALALFYQLQEPGTLHPGDEGFEDAEEAAKTRRVMTKIRGIFGLDPLPDDREDKHGARPSAPQQWGRQDAGVTEADAATDLGPADDGPFAATAGSGQALEVATLTPETEEANPYPDITEEQWAARVDARQFLENILTHQIEMFDAQHHELLRQSVAGPSAHERAAEIAPTHPNAALMQRIEDSNFRQASRMASLFIRLKRLEKSTDESGNHVV
jgi:hypothetical protein